MQNNNNLLSMTDAKKLYESMDELASLFAYSNNLSQPQWWIERKKNSKLYYPVFKTSEGDKFFLDAISSSPEINKFLIENSWTRKNLIIKINESVLEQIKNDSWKASRHSKSQTIRSFSFRPFIKQWSLNDSLRHLYWENRCNNKDFGSQMDIKFFDLHFILSSQKANRENIKNVEKILNSILSRKNNWEMEASQSFRYWVSLNKDEASRKRWNNILDKKNISYRQFQNSNPIVLLAIEENKFDILHGWMKETGLSCEFTPISDEVPNRWWEYKDEKPSTNLWNWMCFIGSLDMIEKTLDHDPNLINSKDFSGKNALHWACLSARTDVIDFLLSKNINILDEDIDGYIPSELIPPSHDNLFEALEKYKTGELDKTFISLLEESKDKSKKTYIS